jgi:iron complex outermembrane receptor protein
LKKLKANHTGHFAIWVLTSTILGGALMSENALASGATQHFNIAAQSLNNALMRFAADADLELIFNADMVRGCNAKSLIGNMTPAQALTQLLQDCGVTYRFVDEHTVTLERLSEFKTPKQPAQTDKNSLPKNNAKPAQEKAPVTLGIMMVTGDEEDDANSYRVVNAVTATKTDTPIKEIPQSIQVIPRALMNDQQNITVSEMLTNVSGVVPRNVLYTPVIEGTLIRGFRAEQSTDGFNQYYNPGDRESIVNIDKIEVLKGSNAILYSGGSGSPVGGMVNVLSKLPKLNAFCEAGIKIGSYDFYQPYFDWNQPVNENVLFRMTGEFTNSQSHIDVIDTERFNINPALTLTNNDTTTLTLQGKVSRWQQPDYQGLPATGSVSGDFRIRPETFIGPANISDSHSNADGVWGSLDHQINKMWSINVKARYAESEFDQKVQSLFGADGFVADVPLLAPSTWTLANAELYQQQQEFSVLGNAVAKINIGPTESTFLLGADYSELDDDGFINGDFGALGLGVAMVDLTAPAFSANYSEPTPGINNTFVKNTTYGGYVQLQSTFYKRFHQLLSLRLGAVEIDYKSSTGINSKTAQLQPLPRVGAVFDVTDDIAVFASYSEGMRGQPFVNFIDTPLPELSKHLETGIKFDFSSQLTGQLAVYQIDRSHVAVPTGFGSIAAGQQRSRGFEADAIWQPSDAVGVLANYAYTQARFTDNLAGVPVGNSVAMVPENSGRLWANYRFQQQALKGLSVGFGVYLRSGAFVSNNNLFKTDGYHTFDAAIAYETKHFKLATTVKNLTGEDYFQPYNYFAGRTAPAAGPAAYVNISLKY